LHSNGIVHRDLKPDNILYKLEGDTKIWKISDFGTSVKNKESYKTSVRHVMTEVYASKEHLSGDEPEPAFDIWSAGIILYELIKRKLPYPNENPVKFV